MKLFLRQHKSEDNIAEAGFVLIMAMVFLLLVSLFGIWALKTSTSEVDVAGGSQQVEQQFNITEGAVYAEGGKVGFILQPFYQIYDPCDHFQLLVPTTDNDSGVTGDFDPGGDTSTPRATIAAQANGYSGASVPVSSWPWENLMRDYTNSSNNNAYDYRYLTTYLYWDSPPLGYNASQVSAYKFRLESAATSKPLFVEVGGMTIGPAAQD